MKKLIAFFLFLILFVVGIIYFSPAARSVVGIDPAPTIVGVQPLGDVPDSEIVAVINAVREMYDYQVVELKRQDLPEMAYTEIRYPRYRADSILTWLCDEAYQSAKPDSINIILSLTKADISITKYNKETGEIKDPEWKYKDFGIFGLGRIHGGVCVVSSHRLANGVSQKIFQKRLTRIACHEVGHVLGLRHCPVQQCLMNDANESIRTIDKSTGELCSACKKKID